MLIVRLFLLVNLAPVHIVTGSAGCQEGRDHFRSVQQNSHLPVRHMYGLKDNPYPWSAFRSQDYGYTRLKVYNRTHLQIEQVSVDLEGQVIDGMWLVKTNSTTQSKS